MKRLPMLLAAAMIILVAGCGPASSNVDQTPVTMPEVTSEPAAPTTDAAAPTTMAPEPTALPSDTAPTTMTSGAETGDTASVLAADQRFSMFMSAITAAGLTETLNEAGPVTIFVPNNDAFAMLPPDQLQSLLADPAALRQMLENHMAQGTIRTGDLADQSSISAMNGNVISIVKDGSDLLLDGRAHLLTKDIETTNGIIHEIDAFLSPAN